MVTPAHRLALLLPLTWLLGGCPAQIYDDVIVEVAEERVSLLPGESRTLEVKVSCTYVPCDAVLTVTPPGALPAGVRIDGLDSPPLELPNGSAWSWTLTLRSSPGDPAFDGQIDFSARPANGSGFGGAVIEPIGDSVQLVISPPPPAGTAPVARFAFTPATPAIGQPIAFDATASTGTIGTYRWDFGADGSFEATGPTATYSFGVAGDWPVRLQVVDASGLVGETARTVAVAGAGGAGDATLTLSFTGSGSGVVTFDPPVTACSRDGEPVCSRRFANLSNVVLTGLAYSGARLGGWGPGCSSVSPAGDQCTIFMDGNRQISLRID